MLSRFEIVLRTVLLSLYLRGPGRSCYPVKFSVSRLHAALVFRFPDKPHEERIVLQLLSDTIQELRYGETLPGVGFDGERHCRTGRVDRLRALHQKSGSARDPKQRMEETTMSSSLPPEIFDLIVEHLHDQPTALKTCCTVSKSWVSRARTHLFAHVGISPVESWTRVFPDPSNSPAHYVRSLSISIYSTTRSTDARALICSFRNSTKLRVYVNWCNNSRIFFAQLHGFSPVLKSLHLTYFSTPPSEIFDLVCSFPSLEGLSFNSLTAEDEPDGGWNIPSTSPKLTGTLVLEMEGEILPVVRRLLGLPGGLHFSSISVMCLDREAESVAGLVLGCSNTLESLRVNYRPSGVSPSQFQRLACALSLPQIQSLPQHRLRSTSPRLRISKT